MSPLQWLLHQRVERARELLETTRLPMDQVARACGLGTADSQRKHLVRRTGLTQSAYRSAFGRPATAGWPPGVLRCMIRHATADDLDAIAALHREARATYYRGHLPPDATTDRRSSPGRARAGRPPSGAAECCAPSATARWRASRRSGRPTAS